MRAKVRRSGHCFSISSLIFIQCSAVMVCVHKGEGEPLEVATKKKRRRTKEKSLLEVQGMEEQQRRRRRKRGWKMCV